MADIKTRDAVKGTIKTIDKAAVASQHMKQAYVSTKEKAETSTHARETSAEEYAADKIETATRTAAAKSADQFDRIGRNSVQTTKENYFKAREGVARFKEKRAARSLQKQTAERTAVQTIRTTPQTAEKTAVQTIKTAPQTEKIIKESVRSAGRQTIKTASKDTLKTAGKVVKTAEYTSKPAIKTSQQAAAAARKTAVQSAKTAKRAAQTAKKTAETSAMMTRKAVRATVATVKAIIEGTKALVSALIAGGWIAVLIILVVVLLGCAVSLFGGESESNSYTPVSAEVEAYEPLIQRYAEEYGIPEYVELIKAVMMQESGGQGTDPMQASESGYNTEYPNTPGGITDPEYSIKVGVQSLAVCLTEAETESPIDMERIKLALQSYNFGNGYISWAKSNYGGYSYANAVEFSTMKAEELGWESYGDTQYPSHVLRYYPYGRAFTSGSNQAIVEVALTQIGNEGGEPYWSWYGFTSRQEWCACFVSWCAEQCGFIESGIIPKFSYCPTGAEWFQNKGQWQDRNYEPQEGDLIFFDWDGDGTTDHVGIVEKCENGIVYTVEGNSGDAVEQNQYAVGNSSIYGYGVPGD